MEIFTASDELDPAKNSSEYDIRVLEDGELKSKTSREQAEVPCSTEYRNDPRPIGLHLHSQPVQVNSGVLFVLSSLSTLDHESRAGDTPPIVTMASEFIGYTILVTLKSPAPQQQLRGVVADVVEQTLVLNDGTGIRRLYAMTDICQ